MPKYGSSSVSFFVDGYNLITTKLKALRYKVSSAMESSHGLGDSWEESTPVGLGKVELAQEGAFFDTTATTGGHVALSGSVPSTPQATQRIACAAFAGQTLGLGFVGVQGAYTQSYDVLSSVGALTKANTEYSTTGRLDNGVILQVHTALTATTTGTGVDNATSSANGGAAYLQVTAYSGFTSVACKVQHSTDNSVWADLATFTSVTASPVAERVAYAGTINRYLRSVVTVTGTGSITVFIGASRS